MGRGYLFPRFPTTSQPSNNAWVTAVRGLINNAQIPGPWGTLVPPWESLRDGRSATHVRADFQDAYRQLALQGQGPNAIQILNGIYQRVRARHSRLMHVSRPIRWGILWLVMRTTRRRRRLHRLRLPKGLGRRMRTLIMVRSLTLSQIRTSLGGVQTTAEMAGGEAAGAVEVGTEAADRGAGRSASTRSSAAARAATA